jgi:ribonucleoside-diphosphate reductase beta chain
MFVKKRDGTTEVLNYKKIESAITRALASIGSKDYGLLPQQVANDAIADIATTNKETIHVDEIHTIVENILMKRDQYELAREYIGYRVANKRSVFNKRVNLKPYEYPNLLEYVNAIRHSYWVHTEFNYTSDIQDLKVKLTKEEAGIVNRAMLAISQIEVQVKTFWAKVGDRLPKPEIQSVGATFAESEVRHADAYSNLLELMGLNEEFKKILTIPAIQKRITYLDQAIQYQVEDRDYFKNIILFSMFVENVSLFSQFLIMMSFNKHRNVLKGISNAVEATSKEEDIHARFGFDLVNLIKKENPRWFTPDIVDRLKQITMEAYIAESEVVDWIYGGGDLEFLPKALVKEFVKDRFNQSMKAIGLEEVFEVDKDKIKETSWFTEEMLGTKNVDFFVKRSTAYSKKTKSFTEDDLF